MTNIVQTAGTVAVGSGAVLGCLFAKHIFCNLQNRPVRTFSARKLAVLRRRIFYLYARNLLMKVKIFFLQCRYLRLRGFELVSFCFHWLFNGGVIDAADWQPNDPKLSHADGRVAPQAR
jgi:hypothetical protein